MPEITIEDVHGAVNELQKKLKTFGVESVEYKTAVENTVKIIEQQEEKNQQTIRDIAAERKAREDQAERIQALEIEVARGTKGTVISYNDTPEYKALQNYFQYGEKRMEPEYLDVLQKQIVDLKALRTDIDTQGGYLTTTEFDDQIIKQITEMSNIRSVSRVRTITDKSLTIPTRTGIPTVTHEGEAEAVGDSNSTYGSEQLTPYRLSTSIPYTMDMLQASRFSLESEISGDATEAFGQQMGEDYVLGTGLKMSEGFIVNATVLAATSTSEASGAISAKDMTDLTGELKLGYNPMYGFNRKTLAYLRSLEDGAGRPIWQLTMKDGAPNLINGEPYIILPDMADVAASSISVVYADFMRGYTITDRAGMVIIRDEFALKKQAMIEMTFHRWTYGQVVLPEAFVILTTKA